MKRVVHGEVYAFSQWAGCDCVSVERSAGRLSSPGAFASEMFRSWSGSAISLTPQWTEKANRPEAAANTPPTITPLRTIDGFGVVTKWSRFSITVTIHFQCNTR